MGNAVGCRDAAALVHYVDAEQCRNQEEDTRQKAESQIRLKLITRPLIRNIAPLPNAATIHGTNEVRQ